MENDRIQEGVIPRPKKGYEDLTISEKIQFLGEIHYIFWLNDKQIKESLVSLKDEGTAFLLWTSDDNIEMFHLRILCQLHNYLAAARTFFILNRKIANELYKGTDFEPEYKEKMKTVIHKSPLAHFMQNLRIYISRKKLPFSSTMSFVTGPGFDSSLSLDLQHLRQWEGWSQQAKEYLHQNENEIQLAQLINNYTFMIEEFYTWLRKRQQELHFQG
jgi:hypothetical protein